MTFLIYQHSTIFSSSLFTGIYVSVFKNRMVIQERLGVSVRSQRPMTVMGINFVFYLCIEGHVFLYNYSSTNSLIIFKRGRKTLLSSGFYEDQECGPDIGYWSWLEPQESCFLLTVCTQSHQHDWVLVLGSSRWILWLIWVVFSATLFYMSTH